MFFIRETVLIIRLFIVENISRFIFEDFISPLLPRKRVLVVKDMMTL